MKNYRKLIGAILGGVTGGGLVALAAAIGWDLPEAAAMAIAGGVAAVGTLVAPPNRKPYAGGGFIPSQSRPV